ncbi:monocarboxylate transporter 12-like [Patiria miniata]|uniref:Major facilitator superfamily (MFS) profile domain-containing protein n=1 Tax=Patiria miniata TaxID=46514 RepID=A0A913Z9X2_PATMI|nr:monocarboxylate transporter 12-like [Patiria miniata]
MVKKDGGYGWVLTAMAFFMAFIELGTFKSFGVFLLPIRESLQCSVTTIGTVMAAAHTTTFMLIPLVNILGKKHGTKVLAVGGGFIMFVCGLGTCLAYNIAQFSVFVILWGVGVAMSHGPPIVEMLLYFPNNPALPFSIISSGAGFGMMLCPPLAEFLIDIYGWRGAMLLFAALSAHICVLGVLIKPSSSAYTALGNGCSRFQKIEDNDNKLRRCCTLAFKSFCEFLALDVLWYEPKFIIHALVSFLVGVMYSAWMIFLVPHAIARGIESQLASFLSSVGGVGTLLGRIIQGPVMHRNWIQAVQLSTLLAFLNALAFVLDPIISDNYPGLACLAFVNGLSLGTMAVLFILVAKQVLSEDLSVQGWGTLLVFFAIGELLGGALAGLSYDATGSYDISYWILGGLSGVAVVVLVAERIQNLCCGN